MGDQEAIPDNGLLHFKIPVTDYKDYDGDEKLIFHLIVEENYVTTLGRNTLFS